MTSRLVTLARRLRTSFGYRAGPTLNRLSAAVENRWPDRRSRNRLVILDDNFPNPFAAHRVIEFNAYLELFEDLRIYSAAPTFQYLIKEYSRYYPQFRSSIRPHNDHRILRGKGVYIVFLHNAYRFLENVEKAGLPFVFELYPGGEFRLNERVSDERLQRVFSSPGFRKVIVTQKITMDYLVDKGFCDLARIEFILGGVCASNQLNSSIYPRRRYGIDKEILDVCFVAYKHMPGGIDKGYDRFIAAARILARRNQQIRFHVVGSFDESDADIGDLRGRISFYGSQYTDFFPEFYASMDIILSPNIPFVLAPGAFDGFPTSCCIEAGFCGVAVFCTDELGMSHGVFKDREEIVIISREPTEISDVIEEYMARPDRLAELAARGQHALQRVFDLNKQMEPRLRVLSSFLEMNGGKGAHTRSEKHDNDMQS